MPPFSEEQIKNMKSQVVRAIYFMETRLFSYDVASKRVIKYFVDKDNYEISYSQDLRLEGYVLYSVYKHRLRIYSVGVMPEYQSTNLGKGLIRFVEIKAKKLGKVKVSLECKKNLVSFYTKLGYKVTRCLPSYYDDGSEGYKMEKKIDG